MSGHSKWNTIKRKKAANDSKRSKIFSKIIKEITVAVKAGGAEIEANSRLKTAISNARGQSVPRDTIDRAIKKGSDKDSANFDEVTFEGYSVGGVAIFVECTTDNNNRTVSNIRSYFSKQNGNLATNGSVDYLFERKGTFSVPKEELDEEEFILEMIDAGAEDAELVGDIFVITTALEDFGSVQKKLDTMNIQPENAELQRIPFSPKQVDVDTARKVMKLVDTLEDDDDVKAVYHEMELTDEVLEVIS